MSDEWGSDVRDGWEGRALDAEAELAAVIDERDEARKLLDELCEIVAGEYSPWPNGRFQQVLAIGGLLRERHASWEGWKR